MNDIQKTKLHMTNWLIQIFNMGGWLSQILGNSWLIFIKILNA